MGSGSLELTGPLRSSRQAKALLEEFGNLFVIFLKQLKWIHVFPLIVEIGKSRFELFACIFSRRSGQAPIESGKHNANGPIGVSTDYTCRYSQFAESVAMIRSGPPLPPAIFIGSAITVNPLTGS